MMTAEIPDEILHPGDDRMRALICVGGNPAVALPDQARATEALSALELLVVVDPRMTATARLADYVFAPTLQYERADHTLAMEAILREPFAHATPAVVPPPADADLVEDWLPLWSLARSCGRQLEFGGHPLPLDEPPTLDELFAIQTVDAPVPLAEVAARPGGHRFDGDPLVVREATSTRRFQLVPDDVADEVRQVESEMLGADEPVPSIDEFLLTVRRHRETNNSTGADFAATWDRLPGNPAYLHPDDLAALGLEAGDLVELVRGPVRIAARAATDAGVRRGVVSVGHCRPGHPSRPWEATNALVDADRDVQSINRMPIMSGVPVRIERWVMDDPADRPEMTATLD